MLSKFLFILLVITLFLIPISTAKLFPEQYLESKKGKLFNGKNVTFIAAGEKGVNFIFEVDGIKSIIRSGEILNGVKIEICSIFPNAVVANITVDFFCGDGVCETTENKEVCCKDCGCEEGKTCFQNRCVKKECIIDSDCEDYDNCTIDSCEEYLCVHTKIEKCQNNDGCCPKNCNEKNDNDCVAIECRNDQDCKKEDPCIVGFCNNTKCSFTKLLGYPYNNTCLKVNETIEEYYCSNEGLKKRKKVDSKCKSNFECLSNICFNGKCVEKIEKLQKNRFPFRTLIIVNLVVLFFIFIYLLSKRKEIF